MIRGQPDDERGFMDGCMALIRVHSTMHHVKTITSTLLMTATCVCMYVCMQYCIYTQLSMYVNVYIIEYLVSNRCIVAFVQACLCLVLHTKCELSVCVCVCVCTRSYQVFSTTQPPLHPQHECATGSLCKSQGLHMCTGWPGVPASHSRPQWVSEWCTHSKLYQPQQTINSHHCLSFHQQALAAIYLWTTTMYRIPTHIKVCNLCSVKTTEKGVYYWLTQYYSTKAHFR